MLIRQDGVNRRVADAVAELIGIALGWERTTSSTYLPQGTPLKTVHESGIADSIATAISRELTA